MSNLLFAISSSIFVVMSTALIFKSNIRLAIQNPRSLGSSKETFRTIKSFSIEIDISNTQTDFFEAIEARVDEQEGVPGHGHKMFVLVEEDNPVYSQNSQFAYWTLKSNTKAQLTNTRDTGLEGTASYEERRAFAEFINNDGGSWTRLIKSTTTATLLHYAPPGHRSM
eukprot:150900_1